MATEHSFDVVSKVDMQEFDNALNQARKEIQQRYDLKDANASIEFNQKEMELVILSSNEMTLKSVIDVFHSKLIKRGIAIKTIDYGKTETASHQSVRQKATIKQGIDKELAKQINSAIKEMKLKVQSSVQGDVIRVSGRSIDDLQMVQSKLTNQTFALPLHGFRSEDDEYLQKLLRWAEEGKIGGIVSNKGHVVGAALQINRLQSLSKVPLIVSGDFEWGSTMRLDGGTEFPTAMSLAATRNSDFAFEIGKLIGQELKAIGFHINFAPVLDINNNPKNPIINTRSYSEHIDLINLMSGSFIRGLELNGIIAVVKHFPGHGNVTVDSHKELPTINSTRSDMDRVEFAPFKKAIESGIRAVMVGHLSVPLITGNSKLPATLSKIMVTNILKEDLGFKGIVITDALDMAGVRNNYADNEIAVMSLEAGCHVLLMPKDLDLAYNAVLNAVQFNKLSMSILDSAVLKVLKIKQFVGLQRKPFIDIYKLGFNVGRSWSKARSYAIQESAVTVLKNNKNVIPLDRSKKVLNISIQNTASCQTGKSFFNSLLRYSNKRNLKYIRIDNESTVYDHQMAVAESKKYDFVIISVYVESGSPEGLIQLKEMQNKLVSRLLTVRSKRRRVVLVSLGNPYLVGSHSSADAIICGYESTPMSEEAIAKIVYGRINISSRTLNIGKSKASLYESPDMNTKVTFRDVAGLNEAKEEVMEIVDFLKDPKRFTKLGGKLPKGVLLVGPPGTGKTLMAKAVAGEAGVPFFSLSGSDFVEMFVGVGAARVRDLFKNAKEKAPCIIFIDEIDAVGRSRGRGVMMGNNDERESTLNQLLVEMDGFATDKGVILIGATNRPDVLDSALLRPGRFDRQIVIDRPDMEGRIEIFKVHTKGMSVNESVNLRMLASQTPGFAGAEIANVCNEAALLASRRNKELIELIDFQDAIERVIAGLEKKNKVINIKERKIVAFHESGHAIVSWLMPPNDPVQKVSIVPRGVGALGYTINVPLEDRYLMTKNELIARMCGLLGGRVAEDIIFGEISTGAQNDLERITELAYNMVTVYGMSPEIGYLSFPNSNQNHYIYNPTGQRTFSEETSKLIDSAAKKLIDDATHTTKGLLELNKDKLNLMATELLQREVLNYSDLETILGKRHGDEPFKQANLNETNNNNAMTTETKNMNSDNSNIKHEERIELETAVEKIKISRNKVTS
ncbi:hypothetical protein CHS0354_024011 [Potamilus streckersoni]|uniref:AAA+ ATPase domain-containing protein n=1 Tax=Potamilus streckersoni TaxID=2493646 RepID=A0AAE0VLN3_9BIVA|nr:hypothetical protein CHS0354_024011 [Potamilus streckersoni]